MMTASRNAQVIPRVRISGIDICRSIAIVLAMASHSFTAFHVPQATGYRIDGLRFVFQMAPPVFIALFGAMLEIAYAKKFLSGQAVAATGQLLNRAVQCYLLYVISLLALVISGHDSPLFAARSMLFLGVTPFTDILKFYALTLVLAPLIIWLRLRYGLKALILFSLLIQASYPLIKLIADPGPLFGKDYFGPLAGFLYGGGFTTVGGPSLLHGLTFVACGMVIGKGVMSLLSPDPEQRRAGMFWLGLIFSISAAATIYLWSAQASSVVTGIARMELRNDNHPLYFALGLTITTTVTTLCVVVFDVLKQRWADWLRFMGEVSLFTFCFGNIILYLVYPARFSGLTAVILSVVFLALIMLQSWLFKFAATREIATLTGPARYMALVVRFIVERSKQAIGNLVVKPARVYAALLWDSDGRPNSKRGGGISALPATQSS